MPTGVKINSPCFYYLAHSNYMQIKIINVQTYIYLTCVADYVSKGFEC